MTKLPEHVAVNRGYWDGVADDWVAAGERCWAQGEPTWGIWGVPDSQVTLLPADMTGMRAIELGCGTGYVSAWMARRGATVTGVDNSERQLATAARLAAQHGVELELIHGNAERVDKPDGSYDFAVSEYGAAIGPTRTSGFPRPIACWRRAASCRCWAVTRWPSSARRSTARCRSPARWSGRTSACTGSTGETRLTSRAASSSPCRSPTG